jgi:hypothetical protein
MDLQSRLGGAESLEVWVGGLPYSYDEVDVRRNLFEGVGEIKVSKMGRGWAHIQCKDRQVKKRVFNY